MFSLERLKSSLEVPNIFAFSKCLQIHKSSSWVVSLCSDQIETKINTRCHPPIIFASNLQAVIDFYVHGAVVSELRVDI